MGVIAVPVADLRRSPEQLVPKDYSHNPLRDSQLLFGERIVPLRQEGEWWYIQALEQMRHTANGWGPYEGWIHQSEWVDEELPPPNQVVSSLRASVLPYTLSYGTYLHQREDGTIALPGGQTGTVTAGTLRPLTTPFSRTQLIQDSTLFLGLPYLWGGRGTIEGTSIDCSGLTNLLYRGQGILIPRDAHDQYLKSQRTENPQPGDLIFLAREERPERISHVMLYKDGRSLVESPETGKRVRSLQWQQEVWREGNWLRMRDRPARYHAFFNTYRSAE